MSNVAPESKKVYVGFDVSQKNIEIFCVCGEKTSKGSVKIVNSKTAIQEFLGKFKKPQQVCVVMETGTHSAWMSRFIGNMGFEVLVAHARDLALIYASDKKNDSLDAEKLARLAQADRKLMHPIEHMDEERQKDLIVLKTRSLLVKQRTQTVNSIRGHMRSLGLDDSELSIQNMKKNVLPGLAKDIQELLSPLIQHLAYLNLEIELMDKKISKLCRKYRTTEILQQVKGIGPAISLAFVLLVGDPRRFRNSAAVASYFGVVPRQNQSGNTDKPLGITKNGNSALRTLLIQGAQYILGPFGEDSELRDFGKRIEARGGKIAKRKARVAVARKIVTLFYALLTHPEIPYETYHKRRRKKTSVAVSSPCTPEMKSA